VTEDSTHDTAGAGSPVPAVPSVQPDAVSARADVVAPEARVELDRIRRRWAELPLDRAEARMPLLRTLLADLAPRTDPQPVAEVPDLGPAVVVDQLAVLVWDAYATGSGDGIPELLRASRRDLG
jgi:hypothetical protein